MTQAEFEACGASDHEIEVTPAMIEAGCVECELWSSEDPSSWYVGAIYRAMEKARRAQDKTARNVQTQVVRSCVEPARSPD